MYTFIPHASHFSARLGATEERTEAYKWYAEGVPQVSDTALQKEHRQSFWLCQKARQCVEEYAA